MKKLLSLVLSFVLVFAFVLTAETSDNAVSVVLGDDSVLSTLSLGGECDAYEFLKWFETGYPSRTTDTDGEYAAAVALSGVLAEMGYSAGGDNGGWYQQFSFINPQSTTDTTMHSGNVIGVKDAADTDKTVVLFAHYDNLADLEYSSGTVYGGDGTVDNGTGVATLLAVANILSSATLPFDLKIVFFGAEELGMFGSAHYVEKLTQEQLSNVLLAVDFNMVGGGDYLYLYCDEVKTEHGELMLSVAEEFNLEVREPPSNKEIYGAQYVDGLPYGHAGLASDVANFLGKGVNCAHLFGYNWEVKNTLEGREFADHANVVGTKNDTLAYYDRYCKATGNAHMNAAVTLVTETLTRSDFVAVAASSAENKFDYSALASTKTGSIVLACLVVVLLAAAVGVYFLLKRKATPELVKAEQDRVATELGRCRNAAEAEWRRNFGELPPEKPAKPQNPFEDFLDEDGNGVDDRLENKDGSDSEHDSDNPFDDFK